MTLALSTPARNRSASISHVRGGYGFPIGGDGPSDHGPARDLRFQPGDASVRAGGLEPDSADVVEAELAQPRLVFGGRVVAAFGLDEHVEAHESRSRGTGSRVV